MKLCLDALEKMTACVEGVEWWKKSGCETVESTIEKLLFEKKTDWANWLIARVLSNDDKIGYAIFAARCVIDVFEQKHPADNRPRAAIEAAENYLRCKTKKEKDAAAHAAFAAARAAHAAARAAARAAHAAARAAAHAAYAADAATHATHAAFAAAYATHAADAAAYAAADEMKKKIIEYGLALLKKENP